MAARYKFCKDEKVSPLKLLALLLITFQIWNIALHICLCVFDEQKGEQISSF